MNNLTRAIIVISTALIVKQTLQYFFPLEDSLTSSSSKSTSNLYPRDFFANQKSGDKKIFLGFFGRLYDVSKGGRFYGKGGSYEFFAGKDATRAFATGDFKNDLNDKIDDLTDQQVAELFNWQSTYEKDYIYMGLLEGAFYDSKGEKTQTLLDAELKHGSHAKKKVENEKFNNRFPQCNSQWSGDSGETKLWCSTKSGGVERQEAGKPRLIFNSFHNSHICGCVNEKDLDHPSVKEYEGCDPNASECFMANKK